MGWLHSPPHNPHQLAVQYVEVGLVTQLDRESFEGLPRVVFLVIDAPIYEAVALYCVTGNVKVVSEVRGLHVAGFSAVHSPPFPASPSLRLSELPRVFLVAGLLQSPGARVDHERYYRPVGVVADAVPLALGDEHSIALVEAHWLSFGEG